jgi:hypothetical protein
MASLLDLTIQGDVATISDESKLPQTKLMGPLEPGERHQYGLGYYAADVLDPDGNNIESVFRGGS